MYRYGPTREGLGRLHADHLRDAQVAAQGVGDATVVVGGDRLADRELVGPLVSGGERTEHGLGRGGVDATAARAFGATFDRPDPRPFAGRDLSPARRLRIGYNRAARLVETMETAGVVGRVQSNGSREVLAPPPRM